MEDIRVAIFGVVIFSYFLSFLIHKKNDVNALVVGRLWRFEPSLLLRYRFCNNAPSIITHGYHQSKESIFKLLRTDINLLVVSNKYLGELKSLPDADLSIGHGIYRNFVGKYSMLKLTRDSNIMTKAVLSKLTPAIPFFIPIMQKELESATYTELPKCNDRWAEIDLRDALARITTRMSAYIIVGPDLCRSEAWLKASIKYTETAIASGIVLRLFPAFLHPVVYQLLPIAWGAKQCVRESRRLIIPLVEERRREQAQELQGRSKPNDFVQWMTDLATTDEERDPANIAHRALIMSQASIPPAALAATHTLYDLCAYPEYVTPIIEEAAAVMKEEGGLCPKALYRMRKLDSFMRESQRVNPPQLLSFQRTVGKPLTLSDGLHIPRDAQICVASSAITMDPELYEHPERFDGWRYYKKRLNSAEENRHQFTSVDREWLHFGYGNHACPGRFFTSNQVKMIVIHFLRNYEIAFRSGEGRPKNKTHDELVFPDLAARVLIRERDSAIVEHARYKNQGKT